MLKNVNLVVCYLLGGEGWLLFDCCRVVVVRMGLVVGLIECVLMSLIYVGVMEWIRVKFDGNVWKMDGVCV